MLKEVMTRCHLTFMQVSVNFVRIVLAVDTLMRQVNLPFSVANLLYMYTVVRPNRETGTPFFKECKVAIRAVNNRQASRNVIDLLTYEPVYRYVIPYKADELGRIKLPTLLIEGWAPQCNDFSSNDLSAELNEDAPIA
ncbi:hypothetical protein Acr_00g0089220 [Actinidia rufa]|uniref:Uncharacterized protein n=1 Tax=Actinidia rufa TaxID=165716 RepID=A0A7J0DZ21_9ERIC|nr:hypothetical protein Acr_00g0089220 [Actinidia rufa]